MSLIVAMTETREIRTFAALISSWDSHKDLADDIGVDPTLPAAWKHRDNIPPEHWKAIVTAAVKRGYPISLELLASLSATAGEAKREAKRAA